MRTTLTIEDDVAVELEQLRRARQTSLKAVINEALRRGLSELARQRRTPRQPFRTRPHDGGRINVPGLDNIAEALTVAESEDFR